jgi:hypothetical protein
MPNVTNKSLRKAGVPEALWDRAKKICNSPPYRAKRVPHRAEGGPFSTFTTGCPLWLDEASTAPIKVGDEVGYYKKTMDALMSAYGCRQWGVVAWVKLS